MQKDTGPLAVRLRDFAEADLPTMGQALTDPRVTAYYGLSTEAGTPQAIAREQLDWLRELQALEEGWWQAIVAAEDGALVGGLGAYDRDDDGDSADLGFWLLPAYWGRGAMRQALRQFAPRVFARLRLHSLVAYVEPVNTASAQVLRACGFQHEGLLRECTRRGSAYVSLERYSLLRSELPPA
ncbi:MAG: GNAT family N-acetyltransferase [Comamonas sp.]